MWKHVSVVREILPVDGISWYDLEDDVPFVPDICNKKTFFIIIKD